MSHQSRFDARYWMLGAGAMGRPRGMGWGGRREEGSGWGTPVYLWWIHFDIWQNQYNIVKFKNKIELKKEELFLASLCFFAFVKRVIFLIGYCWPVATPAISVSSILAELFYQFQQFADSPGLSMQQIISSANKVSYLSLLPNLTFLNAVLTLLHWLVLPNNAEQKRY